MLTFVWRFTLFALAALSLPVFAQSGPTSSLVLAQNTSAATAPMVAGEVRKIDKDVGKITLKHDAIPNLQMPGMTMVFLVKDLSMLDRVKAGDKVRFAADKVGGALMVTQIEADR
jgi:Cu(I)/Ag(I) efflux system protein CusF